MKTSVNFTSSLFTPFLSDDAQVNPECYGAELAWWLSKELSSQGVETSYPEREDWGWYLEYFVDEDEYMIGCGSVTGTPNNWHIFVESQAKGLFGKNKAPIQNAEPLLLVLQSLLSETEGISNIEWDNQNA